MDSAVNARALFPGACETGQRVSAIVGWEVRQPDNIGAIVRLAANFGCKRVLFVDAPGTPHNHRRIRKTAVSAPSHVDWGFISAAEFAAADLPPIVGLETSLDSQDLRQTPWPQTCALMVGSESYGLPDAALELCQLVVHIPTGGPLKSLNVSHALAIALFEATRSM